VAERASALLDSATSSVFASLWHGGEGGRLSVDATNLDRAKVG